MAGLTFKPTRRELLEMIAVSLGEQMAESREQILERIDQIEKAVYARKQAWEEAFKERVAAHFYGLHPDGAVIRKLVKTKGLEINVSLSHAGAVSVSLSHSKTYELSTIPGLLPVPMITQEENALIKHLRQEHGELNRHIDPYSIAVTLVRTDPAIQKTIAEATGRVAEAMSLRVTALLQPPPQALPEPPAAITEVVPARKARGPYKKRSKK